MRCGVGALATASLLAGPATVAHAQDEGPGLNIVRDTEIEEILHKEMDPVFAAANLDPKRVQLYVVADNDTLNAETGTGYNMVVFSGLILKTKTPDELEGVLAHETGHMARGDVARMGEATRGVVGPMILGLGLGILAAIAGAPDAAAALIYSGSYFGELNGLAFSRDDEARADAAAITYLEKAGYSGRGIVDFFNYFRYEENFSDIKKYPFWVDHPLSDERVALLTERAKAQPHWNTPDSPESIAAYELMKAKLKAYTQRPFQTYVDYPDTDVSFPARYARAIADFQELDTDKGLKEIDALIAERPDDPYLYEVKGQSLMEVSRAEEGEAALRKAVDLKPDAPLLRVLLAQDLLAENLPAKVPDAIINLNRSLVVEPDSPIAWQYLSEAYDAKGDEGMARLATAEQEFHLGQMKDARGFAMRAREFLKRGTPEWQRATDIVLTSNPSADDLRAMNQQE
ncbi:MAG TPA: M48 family metalloprotease [Caulobacteraceae bacterium]|nr:M48 family metalloprotease [Caulobacteraceae bacterium]